MGPEPTGWRALVMGPRAGRVALIVAFAVSAPFLVRGLFMDDYFLQLLVEGATTVPGSRLDLFAFASGDAQHLRPLIEHGPFPWWTSPTLRLHFFRPLTAVLANLEHLAFGRAFFWHHLHSLLWYLGLVAAVTALLRRALGAASLVAALAAVLFAFDDAHWMPVGWLANRNALVATVPALLGVLAHTRWREHGWWPGLPLSLLGSATGLAGGEAALGALAYLAAYELTIGPGSWGARARALLPSAVVGLAYVVVTRAVDAGTSGSGMYNDPLGEPLAFLANAPERTLTLIGAQFLAQFAEAAAFFPAARPALVGNGLAALAMMGWVTRALWPALGEQERRGLRWLTLGAALSLVPVVATHPSNRLLLMPSIGGAALVAVVLRHGFDRLRPRAVRFAAGLLLVTNVVLSVVGWGGAYLIFATFERLHFASVMQTELSDAALQGRVVVFAAPEPVTGFYVSPARAWYGKPAARAWLTLSYAPYDHQLTRTATDTIELEVIDGRMLETTFERLMRSPALPLQVGTTVKLDGLTVEVLALDRGLPSRLGLQFDEDPQGGGFTFAQWREGRLGPLTLPAVGAQVTLTRPPQL
ncbi:MAG: hypothetical protein Q8L14_10350 [Myxococcales bacterium]|nr:hypothetical protein [Myxococcales bacterium]